MSAPAGPSLWEPLALDDRRSDLLYLWDDANYTAWSWDEWRSRALRVAGGLHETGMRPGDRVACLLTNSPGACAAVLGIWLAGGCVLSLPLIARGMDVATYLGQLKRMIAQSEPVAFLCEARVADLIGAAGLDVPITGFQHFETTSPRDPELPAAEAGVFVQYTSGSTTEPQGCVLTARAIACQLASLEAALAIDPERDTGVVWLPLSHDMGLFGCLMLTYWTGHRLVLGTPQRFLRDPASWFGDCARFGATVSAAPGFALDISTRVARSRLPRPFPMTRLVIGGERVEADTLSRATEVLERIGVPPSALLPAYGLAEAVLAVSISPLGRQPRVVEDGTRHVVSAGPPLPGCDVRILGDAAVGEIVVRTRSLADGYLEAPGVTAERFTDEGLLTRDIGFTRDGEVFVTGRIDDLMILGGRNVYAHDLEASVRGLEGLRSGGCSVVDIDGPDGQRLVAVVEPADSHPDYAVMAQNIRRRIREAGGVTITECVFMPRGELPKTPSGKIQRFRCKEIAASRASGNALRVTP